MRFKRLQKAGEDMVDKQREEDRQGGKVAKENPTEIRDIVS